MSDSRFTRFLPPEDYEKLRTKYPKFNEPWDDEEVEELKRMYAAGQPVQAMAGQLGRTPNIFASGLRHWGSGHPRRDRNHGLRKTRMPL